MGIKIFCLEIILKHSILKPNIYTIKCKILLTKNYTWHRIIETYSLKQLMNNKKRLTAGKIHYLYPCKQTIKIGKDIVKKQEEYVWIVL